ncbi:MAG: MBL fold metallo-hydrolase [Gammaproteobacteria bacterium]|nr:MBL fold metallo-hydrolase [Gammaproteobacteria bacterium]
MLSDTRPHTITIQFWGVRGTLPVPGKKSIRYGGNTNCMTLKLDDKEYLIFDAGTGIKEFSNFLVQNNHFPLKAKFFISHPHYDHIQGLPFFVPLYMKGNHFEFYGAVHGGKNIKELIAGQMDSIYFPVTISEFSSDIQFRTLAEESFTIDDVHVQTIYMQHPGTCLGYRIQYHGRVLCYVTDNELFLKNSPQFEAAQDEKLIQFIKNADVVMMDTTYTDTEYLAKVGWGHSCLTRAVEIADKANVQLLCLHHHDPEQNDKDIDQKLKQAKQILKSLKSKTRAIAPREGEEIILNI